jgi:predicted DNA binding CopG/RHH family protein
MKSKRAVMKKRVLRSKLDREESELAKTFRLSAWDLGADLEERDKLREAAKKSKSERTNIRLPEADLKLIKLRAQELGLGYQTLIASLLHQYVEGNLVELSAVRRLFAKELGWTELRKQAGKSRA